MIDLQALTQPTVVETLSFEAILAAAKADFAERMRPYLPQIDDILTLESDPIVKLLEAHAYRELLFRARVNDAARAHLLAFAEGADLDHLAAFYGLERMPGELDERYRVRVQKRILSLAANGTAEQYELVAMSATLDVKDALATQPQPGRVRVLVWVGQGADTTATVQAVQQALDAPGARPLGVPVTVALATPKPVNITATLWREQGAPVTLVAQVAAALPAAMAAYARMGRAVPRSWVTTRLHMAGIAAVHYTDATAPAETTPMAADEYPVLGTVTLTDGGVM